MFVKAASAWVEVLVVDVASGDSSACFFKVPFYSGLVELGCGVAYHMDKPFRRTEVGEAPGGVDEDLSEVQGMPHEVAL